MLLRLCKSLLSGLRGRKSDAPASAPLDALIEACDPRAAIDMRAEFLESLRAGPAPQLIDDSAIGEPALVRAPSCIVLAGCDPRYFRDFALPFATSLERNGALDCAVELQMLGPDPWIGEEVDALRAAVPSLPVKWHGVAIPRVASGVEGEAVHTWCACLRFLRLPALLEQHRIPVLVLDLDLLVEGRLDSLVARAQDADAVIVEGPGRNAWDRVDASALVVRATPSGIAFADLVRRYIAHFLAKGIAPWHLAQIALLAASMDAAHRKGGARIAKVKVADWPMRTGLDHETAVARSQQFQPYMPRLRRAFGWTMPGSDTFFPVQLAYCKSLLGRPTWEAPMLEACLTHVAGRGRALDVGAHVGFWSRWLASHFEHVDAFEPQALLQECLRANVEAANVTLHALALGDRSGTMAAVLDTTNTGMSHISETGGGQVVLRKLDEFDFSDVDFIKLDVEGYELSVLRGAVDTLRRNLPMVLVEQTDNSRRYGTPRFAAVSFLESLGAHVVKSMSKYDYLLGWESREAWREPVPS